MAIVNHNRASAPGFEPRLFLRDEELDYGIALLLAAERALMRQAGQLAKTLHIPPLAARILVTLRFQPGPSVKALREQLDTTVPTMARLIADLDASGLIERRKSLQDARARALHLTDKGVTATDAAADAMRASMRAAYRDAGSEAVAGVRAVLEGLS